MGNNSKKAKNNKRGGKKAGGKGRAAGGVRGRGEEKPLSPYNFGTGGRLFTLLAEKVDKPVRWGDEDCAAIYGRLCGKVRAGDDLYFIERETREVTLCRVAAVLSADTGAGGETGQAGDVDEAGDVGEAGEAAAIRGVVENVRVKLLLKVISCEGQPCSLEDVVFSTFSVACSAKPKTLREGGANFGLRESVFLRGLLGSAEELENNEEFFNLMLRELVDSTYLIPAGMAADHGAKAASGAQAGAASDAAEGEDVAETLSGSEGSGSAEDEADLWSELEFPLMENPNTPGEDCMLLFTDVQAFRHAAEAGVGLPFESAMMDGFAQVARVAAGNGDGIIVNPFGPVAFVLSSQLVRTLAVPAEKLWRI